MPRLFLTALCVLVSGMTALPLGAATLVEYETVSTAGSIASFNTAPGVSDLTLGRGSGLVPQPSTSPDVYRSLFGSVLGTKAAAVAAENYYTFGFGSATTPVLLETLSLTFGRNAFGPQAFGLDLVLNGVLFEDVIPQNQLTVIGLTTESSASVDFSTLTGVNAAIATTPASSAEFRLIAWGGTNANAEMWVPESAGGGSDIVLTGTAIPEPAVAVLAGLGGAVLLGRRVRTA